MTASVASGYAANKIRTSLYSSENSEADRHKTYQKMAGDIVHTLGELKGAAMKVGQIASQAQDLLPKEFSEALQSLQQEAPPMDYGIIRQQVIDELGEAPEVLFTEFEEEPYAAASIGQVHRAKTRAGQSVIVKVQYPGIDKSLDSDLKQLRLTLKLGGLLKLPKASVDQLFEEIKARLGEELDYSNEARNIEDFRRFHHAEQELLIPAVVPELSSQRILTLDYIAGDHISKVTTGRYSQQTINRIGHRLFRILADQLFVHEAIHGDPHPGNFAFRPDGTIIMYDFGCVKRLKPGVVSAYKRAVIAGFEEDYRGLDQCLTELGIRNEKLPCVDEKYYAMWRDIAILPFVDASRPYHFGTADLHQRLAANIPTILTYIDYFKPPVETIFIDRLISGHYWMMRRLQVQAAFRTELEHYLGMSSQALDKVTNTCV